MQSLLLLSAVLPLVSWSIPLRLRFFALGLELAFPSAFDLIISEVALPVPELLQFAHDPAGADVPAPVALGLRLVGFVF